jgi:hypothetical protein
MRWKAISLAAIVIVVAGCGGGGHNSATTSSTVTAAAAAAKAKSTATTNAAAAAAAAGYAGLATNANCRQLADLSAEYAQALQGATSTSVAKTSSVLKQFADKTPSDIRPAFETVASDYAKVASALQGVHLKSGSVPNAAAMAKLAKLGSEINTTQLTQAETKIGTWAQKNCAVK